MYAGRLWRGLSGRWRHLGTHGLLVHVMGRHAHLVTLQVLLLWGRLLLLLLLLSVQLSPGLVLVALLLTYWRHNFKLNILLDSVFNLLSPQMHLWKIIHSHTKQCFCAMLPTAKFCSYTMMQNNFSLKTIQLIRISINELATFGK